MTSAGLYRHFADKEAMFAALVQPALDALKEMMETQTRRAYRHLEKGDLDAMWNGNTDLTRLVEVVYHHLDAFRLLLRSSAGTRFQHFFDRFVEINQAETLRYMEALRRRGIHVNDVVDEELHLLLNAYYAAFFEVVVHDFSHKDALHYLETLKQFFYPGWRAFLGF
jgi:AcrR family transcriptional regulator